MEKIISENENHSIGKRFLPLIVVIAYLFLSILLFFYGPIPYPIEDNVGIVFFLIFAHLALITGYISGVFNPPAGYSGKCTIQRLIIISIIINILFIFPTMKYRTGSYFPNVIEAIRDPGKAYSLYGFQQREGIPIVEYLRILFALPLYLYLPLSFYYWRKLDTKLLLISSLLIVGNIVLYIAMGTNKGIFYIVLLSSVLIISGDLSGVSKIKWFMKLIFGLLIIIGIILFLLFFASTQSTRTGSGAKAGYFTYINRHAQYDNYLIRNLPHIAKVGSLGAVSYLTQGYYGLYLSLEEPFVPMFGVGHSIFLTRQVARITQNNKILSMPYPMRIEKYGWNPYGNWSSIYPWIASDVSFPGTILVVFMIGRLFVLSWLDTLYAKNPFAVAMFSQFIIMLIFFPANNQLLQGGEELVAFYGTFILWIATRKRVNIPKN